MKNFLRNLLGHKKTSQQVNNNTDTTVIQVAGNYFQAANPVNPSSPVFYISKKGKDIEPVELLTTRANKDQGFNPYFYLSRPQVDTVLLNRLTHFKSAIIIGKPLAGKTRSIFQLAKNELSDCPFFIPTDDFLVSNTMELPNSNEKGIIIFDDLNNYVSSDSDKHLLKFFKKALLQHVVVATCQKEKFKEVEQFLQENNLMELFEVIEIPPLSIKDKKEVAQKINKQINDGDDTIGSFILPIEKMKALYKTLPLLEKEILRSYKFLRFISKTNFISQYDVQNYCNSRLLDFHNDNPTNYSFAKWEAAFNKLDELGFFLRIENKIVVEEIYLKELIEPFATERVIGFELTTYMNDVFTYNKVINNVISYKLAKEIFNKLTPNNVLPDVVTFNTLMNKVTDYEEGKKILADMKAAQVKPDGVTFTTLMNKVSDYEEGKKILADMIKANVLPDVFTFNTLMNKVTEYEEGKKILADMKAANVLPNEVTFTTLMNKVSDYEEGKKILADMKVANVMPDEVTFTTLMNKVTDYEQGKKILADMKVTNVLPNEVTFNILMKKAEKTEDLLFVLEQMKIYRIKPDELFLYNLMNRSYTNKQIQEIYDELMEERMNDLYDYDE